MKKENSPGPWQRIRWQLSKHPDFLSPEVQHPKNGEAVVTFLSEFIWEHSDQSGEAGQQGRVEEGLLADGCLVFSPGGHCGDTPRQKTLAVIHSKCSPSAPPHLAVAAGVDSTLDVAQDYKFWSVKFVGRGIIRGDLLLQLVSVLLDCSLYGISYLE